MSAVLAADLGGTRIKAGLVRDGQVLAHRILPAHSSEGLAPRLPALAEAWESMCAEAVIDTKNCLGVGIAFPSLVDFNSCRVLDEHGKYADAPNIDLPAWCQERLGLSLFMENDARMACIGEWQYGAGQGINDLVMITLGTGIGTSAIMQGQVVRGVHHQGGCLGGHFTVSLNGRLCSCGNRGCAEAEASTSVLPQLACETPGFEHSQLAKEKTIDYEAVFRLALKEDRCALLLRERSLEVWSALTVSLIHAYDPARVILGGGVLASKEQIIPAIQNYVDQHSRTPWGEIQVCASKWGDDAALLACQWLVNTGLERATGEAP